MMAQTNIPGMQQSRTGMPRMREWTAPTDVPTWRDPPNVQYAEDFFTYTVPIASLAPGASFQASINIEADSAFEWIMTNASGQSGATGANLNSSMNIALQVTDGASSRNLFSMPIPFPTFAGTGPLPYVLPIPRRFMSKSIVNLNFINFDTAITYQNVSLNLHGRKIFSKRDPSLLGSVARFRSWASTDPDNGAQRWFSEDFFVYAFNFTGAPALPAAMANPQTQTVLIEADSDFEWITSNGYATTAATAAGVVNANVNLTFKDGATSRQLSSSPYSWGSAMGNNGLPFVLPIPRIFKAKSPVTVTGQNYDSTTNYFNPFVTMHGRKIFELNT